LWQLIKPKKMNPATDPKPPPARKLRILIGGLINRRFKTRFST
jgi:hypothetical protein